MRGGTAFCLGRLLREANSEFVYMQTFENRIHGQGGSDVVTVHVLHCQLTPNGRFWESRFLRLPSGFQLTIGSLRIIDLDIASHDVHSSEQKVLRQACQVNCKVGGREGGGGVQEGWTGSRNCSLT